MKAHLASLVFAFFMVAFSRACPPPVELEGLYTGEIDLPFLLILTEQGVTSACQSDLPQQCREELPKGFEQVSLLNGTFAISFTQFVGINTTEAAAAAYPACAAAGIFPFETITPLPLAPVLDYDFETKKLYFVDDRRPADLNCMFATFLHDGENRSIELEYVIKSDGPLSQVLELGPSFRCERPVGQCIIEQTQEDVLNDIYVKFTVPCTEGNCLVKNRPDFRFLAIKKILG